MLKSWVIISKQQKVGWLNGNADLGLKFWKAHGEDSAEQWRTRKLPNSLQKCCADGIYNADLLFNLFNHSMLDSSLSYEHATLSGAKEAMVCVNVLCCSNMSGTGNWKLLIIGRRSNT
jgi:hypothetical protein